ncbi:MAG: RIP metalloprotease RseP [Candidatus Buchananbacteria bacterium RIFCSPLOWO2_01_FULL_56_15]|uniref:Zinc metalloprotease n=2 Tax=Candidatus Buchananiibacteriota TaxID=1817903 RepID=A0A1G1YHH6_9BACT|nr:MAG: RIP metalloprotease RseP [Candidatus Buchananbacteria bacterium RIFCSPHIGHO2_02_FULL_56_16]OGY54807.1 MAG: RIP metalloprotease RseP [Candidatus Buchananbacteria bacterium RIFCSPLOWO2_01_FULL_56_15]
MLLTIVIFFAVLALLVLVHEWGHFIVARRFGVTVEEFGFGLPPRIIGAYKNEANAWKTIGLKAKQAPRTIWSLNWIPLGGFVKIKGEQGEAPIEADSFGSRSVWQRIAIISAGVSMNLVLAAVLLTIGLIVGSPQQLDGRSLSPLARVSGQQVIIAQVLPGSPASSADLKPGDQVTSVDGQQFTDISGLQAYMEQRAGSPTAVTVDRSGAPLTVTLTPVALQAAEGRAGIGVALVETGLVSYPWYVAWWFGIREVFQLAVSVVMGFFIIFKQLIISHQFVGDVYGPVGIATLVGQTARLGFSYLMQFTAMLSVIIAVINFLPFPALDGGRVLFLAIEGIRGKAVNARVEALIHNIGFALLMLLMLLVTFRDILRIWPA